MTPGTGGRRRHVVVIVLALAFLAFGLFVGWHWVRSALFVVDARGWPEGRCVIESSGVVETGDVDDPFRFEVSYRYEAGGEVLRGDRYRWGYFGSADVSEAHRLAGAYPVGAEVPCVWNPEDPTWSSLVRPRTWVVALEGLVPLVLLGLGLAGLGWQIRGSPERGPGAAEARSISTRGLPGRMKGRVFLGAFFGIFLLAGIGFAIPMAILPTVRAVEARSWDEIPCTIERIQVASHAGDDGTTYSVEVLFSYEVDGRVLRSSRFDFSMGADSDYGPKAAAVERHPPGPDVCRVDPEDSFSAVVEARSGTPWWAWLVVAPFVLVGAGGVAWSVKGVGRARKGWEASSSSPVPEVRSEPVSADGTLVLEPSVGPVGKLVGIVVVAAFWNGIVSVFVYQLVKGWRDGSPDGCLAIFLVPFVLVGLVLLLGVPYQILASFNPRPELLLDPGGFRLGGSSRLRWRFRGAFRRIHRLTVTLEGEERATYRRGTDTSTDTETIFSRELVVLDRPMPMGRGEVLVEIPEDAMHSFEAPSNAVVWTLSLHGEIARWPDVKESFPITVEPFDPESLSMWSMPT